MRVLEVYKDIFPEVKGGIERYIHDLSLFLGSRGHRIEILVAGGGRRDIHGIPVTGVPSPGRILSNPVAPGYRRILAGTSADVVHFHLPLPTAVASWLMLTRASRKPYVVTYHSDIVRQAFFMPAYAPVLRRFLREASTVIATSGAYLAGSPYLRSLRNTEVIPIGVDPARFSTGPQGDGKYYLFVGRFRKYKGIMVLLDAWKRLKDPPDLILAGGGILEEKVKWTAHEYGLPVTIMKDVTDGELLDLYRNARALILPSTLRSEAYGMVQLEAMACGTPVISSDLNTGVSWVNRHGETGYTFETGNSQSLALAVERMQALPDLGAGLGRAARKRAVNNFNAATLFGKVEECLLRAAGS